MATQPRYRSFFWPVVLILIGLFALLVDLNVISADRLYRLGDLWPVILIVIGLELIIRRAMKGTAVDVAAALILLIAAGGVVAYVSLGPAVPTGTQVFDTSGAVGSLTAASLQMDVGGATMTVEGNTGLGEDLYRAHIEYSGPKPSVTLDDSSGQLHISQQGGFLLFGNRRFILDLQVNPSVPWSVNVNSGASTDTFNLSNVNVSSMELNTGASREDVTLGPPTGMVPISINGGALTVLIHRPTGAAISVQVSGGAINLTGDGQSARGIGSKNWQSGGYDGAADAYTVAVNGGACNVTVDAHVPAA